jgi:hypothetical protein
VTYIVIDTTGVLHVRPGRATIAAVDREVGPEGWAAVMLAAGEHLTGWVNDIGLTQPDLYPRNVVGSCVLATLGAAMNPYAGPAVITGRDAADPESAHPIDLGPESVRLVILLHSHVLEVLDGQPRAATSWGKALRRYAEQVAAGPTPTLQVTGFGLFDALAELLAHRNRGEH